MTAPSWMLMRVALETSVHHPDADRDRLSVMEAQTRLEYRTALARIFGFEAEVETALLHVSGLDQTLVRARAKLGRLRRDLLALGYSSYDIASLPLASTVSVRSVPQALGWMFVAERHTLLAGVIRRQLARRLPNEMRYASSYLEAYGDTPGAHFRAFGEALGRYAEKHAPASIVAAAGDAFRAQRQWYRSESHEVTRVLRAATA